MAIPERNCERGGGSSQGNADCEGFFLCISFFSVNDTYIYCRGVFLGDISVCVEIMWIHVFI